MRDPAGRLIVALDAGSLAQAEAVVHELRPAVRWFKVGSALFTAAGPDAVRMVHRHGGQVFLDLKWHDIPNTVAAAVRSAAGLGVAMMNVHISAGDGALRAASTAAGAGAGGRGDPVLLIGVTVLTSEPTETGRVVTAAGLARDCGLHGVVASAREARAIKAACGPDFLVVAPGIRPGWAAGDDQRRIAAPGEAIRLGADYLVVGRPITQADDPVVAARKILDEIASSLRAEGDSGSENRTKAAGVSGSFD